MFKFRELVIKTAVANNGGTMEADTISKHGRSSKSHMSRGNFLRKLCFAVLLVAGYFSVNAQDLITLKNGDQITAKVTEITLTEIKYKRFDNPNGPTITIIKSDVFLINYENGTREVINSYSAVSETSRKNARLLSGYKGILELGYQIRVGDFGMNRFKLNLINGYQINPYFSLGFGIGLRYYFDAEAALIPFFADFRVNFIDNNVSPYLSLGVGYSFDATNDFNGVGFLLNPTVGVSFMISDRSAMNVGLGYEMQIMKFYYYPYYYVGSLENSGALSLVVGISF